MTTSNLVRRDTDINEKSIICGWADDNKGK